MAYSTYTNVGNLLNMTFTTSSNPTNTTVTDFISQSDEFIDSFCGHNWLLNTENDEYRDGLGYGPRAGMIILKYGPVISVESVEYYSGAEWKNDTYEGMPQDYPDKQCYYVYLDEGTIFFHKLRLTGRKVYRIAYTWGYETIPDTVQDLSACLAALKVIAYLSGPTFANYSIGDLRAEYPSEGPYSHQWKIIVELAQRLMWQLSARRPLVHVG